MLSLCSKQKKHAPCFGLNDEKIYPIYYTRTFRAPLMPYAPTNRTPVQLPAQTWEWRRKTSTVVQRIKVRAHTFVRVTQGEVRKKKMAAVIWRSFIYDVLATSYFLKTRRSPSNESF